MNRIVVFFLICRIKFNCQILLNLFGVRFLIDYIEVIRTVEANLLQKVKTRIKYWYEIVVVAFNRIKCFKSFWRKISKSPSPAQSNHSWLKIYVRDIQFQNFEIFVWYPSWKWYRRLIQKQSYHSYNTQYCWYRIG